MENAYFTSSGTPRPKPAATYSPSANVVVKEAQKVAPEKVNYFFFTCIVCCVCVCCLLLRVHFIGSEILAYQSMQCC